VILGCVLPDGKGIYAKASTVENGWEKQMDKFDSTEEELDVLQEIVVDHNVCHYGSTVPVYELTQYGSIRTSVTCICAAYTKRMYGTRRQLLILSFEKPQVCPTSNLAYSTILKLG
jgi:hypothetical protein